jgi:hypothetical protein
MCHCSDELRALGPHPGSAELHPQVAAEASYKIFTEVTALSARTLLAYILHVLCDGMLI